MKKMILLVAVSLMASSQLFADGGKNFKVVLDEKTSIDAREVTVADWKVYLDKLKATEQGEENYSRYAMPDAKICQEVYGTENVLEDLSLQNRPIVGLTLDQIEAYCNWRTDFNNKQSMNKKVPEIYKYTLPTLSQLQSAYDKQQNKTTQKGIYDVDLKNKGISGVADNVPEITQDGKIIIGAGAHGLRYQDYNNEASNAGFRCVSVRVR